jgi:hypothetical protein
MRRSVTLDQSNLASIAVLVLALVCVVRWWVMPSRAAARATLKSSLIRTAMVDALARDGIAIAFDQRQADLRWRAPDRCVEVYRLSIDEEHRDSMVTRFVGREPERSSWLLALGQRGRQTVGVLVREDATDDVRERELTWSTTEVGPAAPDFACRRRSWDPIEDALALGWPKLPGARVRVGESWIGASVEGRCHETVCANEQGRFDHDRRCRARPWHEELAGSGNGVALIVSDWDDGHELDEIGVLTQRNSLIHEGRPLRVVASIQHSWSGVDRTLELTRIDDCSSLSLASADDEAAVAEVRAELKNRE